MNPKLVLGAVVGVVVLVGATGGHHGLNELGNGIRDVLHWITHDVFDWISTTWHSLTSNKKAST